MSQISSNSFLTQLSEQWHLTQIDFPSEIPYIFAGNNRWGNVMVFQNAPCHLKRYQNLLKTIPNCIIIQLNTDFVHVYAQSLMDPEPIIAMDIHWQTNDSFWKLGNSESYLGFCFELNAEFGKTRLEKKFVSAFKQQKEKLALAWMNLPEEFDEIRERLALTTLLRLLFIAFIEERGILANRTHFIHEEALKCVLEKKSIFQHFLVPLFFETLNRPYARRTARAKAFGRIPFLNGGLFTPTPIEIEFPNLDVSNAVFLEIIETLFEPYAFNTIPVQDKFELRLDPMMLGHVFESLMDKSQRTSTGSYYTPMPLARQLVLDTFQIYFQNQFNLSLSETDALCSHGVVTFDVDKAKKLENHLSEIAILDPAAGSGAFLQCAFELLHRIRLGLSQFLHHTVDQGLLARQILSRNLYGVDIIPTANQLCELRLWLELMRYCSDTSALSPLPNLDMNIVCGDTLTDLSQFATVLGLKLSNKSSEKLSRLKRKYRLSHGKTKKKLSKEIESETREAGKSLLKALIEAHQREYSELENGTRDLFTHQPSPTIAQKKRIHILQEQIQKLERILHSDDLIPGFSYHLQFGEIIENGGFDIILGNPPWMSLYKLPLETQTVLKSLYQTATPHKSTKRPQSADLSALFVEKAIQCVKPHGFITMIVPNKLFQAPTYKKFQNYIQTHTHMIKYTDWSQKQENTFQANAYPSSIILQNKNTFDNTNAHHIYEQSQSLIFPYPLTIVDRFSVKKGLCTSANDIFIGNTQIDDNTQLNQILFHSRIQATPVPIEKELLYPILRGTDIKAYQAHPIKNIIYGYTKNNPSKAMPELPPLAREWFHSHMPQLKSRKGYQNKVLHAISGSCTQLQTSKVVWRDISKQLEACYIKSGDILPLNTVYYIPVQTEADGYLLSAWLNSSIVRKHCQEIAEHARNNYRRYHSWVIETLPWPFDELSSLCSDLIEQMIKLSEQAHNNPDSISEVQTQIDDLIAKCLNLLPSYKTQSEPPSQIFKGTHHAITHPSSKQDISDIYANPH